MPLNQMRSYCGKNAMHMFLDMLAADSDVMERVVNTVIPYLPEDGDEEAYWTAECCHICTREGWGSKLDGEDKVLDHDHMTGMYRGAAHRLCNASYQSSRDWKLPVYFHNLKVRQLLLIKTFN